MNEDLALLQFVALSLPAVAILMQAVLNYHELHGGSSKSNTIHTEFRFLELSFLGLILAGVVFSLSVFTSATSWWTKSGISILIIALGMIFPATWFALRRGKYPSQSYDSPEDAVKSSVRKSGWIISILVVIGLLGSIVRLFLPSGSIFDFNIADPIILITIPVIVALPVVYSLIQYYTEVSVYRDWAQDVMYEIARIPILVENFHSLLDQDEESDDIEFDIIAFQGRCEDIAHAIRDLVNSKPDPVSQDTAIKLSQIQNLLLNVQSLLDDLIDVMNEKEYYESEMEKAINERDRASDTHYDLESENTEHENAKERTTDAEEYINRVTAELDKLEEEERDLVSELESKLESIKSEAEDTVKSIESDMSSLSKFYGS